MFDEDAWEAFFFNEQMKLGSKYNLLDTTRILKYKQIVWKYALSAIILLDAVVCIWLG